MIGLIRSTRTCHRSVLGPIRKCSGKGSMNVSNGVNNANKPEIQADVIEDLTEPTNCCMSGCTNCVWIQYAEKLSIILEGSDVDMQKMILDKIQDPNMRAFLSMELRFRNIIK